MISVFNEAAMRITVFSRSPSEHFPGKVMGIRSSFGCRVKPGIKAIRFVDKHGMGMSSEDLAGKRCPAPLTADHRNYLLY